MSDNIPSKAEIAQRFGMDLCVGCLDGVLAHDARDPWQTSQGADPRVFASGIDIADCPQRLAAADWARGYECGHLDMDLPSYVLSVFTPAWREGFMAGQAWLAHCAGGAS